MTEVAQNISHELPDLDGIREALRTYGEAHGMPGLDRRIQRGMDPAAMFALPATRRRLGALAEAYGADISDAEALTQELHRGGVWRRASELAEGTSPTVAVWMAAGEATVRNREIQGDLTPDQFASDLERVTSILDAAVEDPQGFARAARQNLVERAAQQFTVEDGVPVSESQDGFLAMAVSGYRSGIVRNREQGQLFVGADRLDFDAVAIAHDLQAAKQEDRGREAMFYVTDDGTRNIKEIYPGLGLIFNDNFELARDLALTGVTPSLETN